MNSDLIETTAGYVADSFVAYSPDLSEGDRRRFEHAREVSTAYVWGRQDAGEGDQDCGPSWRFSVVYALAAHLRGNILNLQDAFDEWTATGRIVIDHRNGDSVAIEYDMRLTDNADRAVARKIPTIRYRGFGYRYFRYQHKG